jgi:PAS domain S-box-containing protein
LATVFRPALEGEDGSHFLHRAAEALSPELGTDEVVGRLRELAVPALADSCAIALVDEDSPPGFLRQRGPSTAIVLPLLARGRVLGEIALDATPSGRRFEADALAVAEELARIAAAALDNARTLEQERSSREDAEHLYVTEHRARRRAEATAHRLARLQAVTAALSEALTASEVAETVLGQGLLATGAHAGSICAVTDEGRSLQVLAHAGYRPQQLDGWLTIPVAKRAPLSDAARTGRPVLLERAEELAATYPELAALARPCRAIAALPLIAQGRVVGAMGLSFDERRRFDRDETTFLCALAQQCGQALDRARAFEAERLARMEAQESVRRLRESVTLLDATLASAPIGFCYLDRDMRCVRVNEWVAAAMGVSRGDAIGRPLDELAPELFARLEANMRDVLDIGRPVEQELEVSPRNSPVELRTWSVNLYPVAGADSDVVGLGMVVVDITDQRRAVERERFLSDATVVLSASLEYQTALGNLARLAVPILADWCVVYVLEPDGSVRRIAIEHSDRAWAEKARRVLARHELDPNASTGVPEVLRTGRSALLERATAADLASDVRDPDALLRSGWDVSVVSWMCVPLRARGHIIGAMSFVSSARPYTKDDLSLAEELAARAALVVDNARLFAERSEAARTLQEGLLPATLPDIPGAEVHGVYHASRTGDVIGGDFYDLFETGPDEWALVIGDVCGKGPRAAVLTALARYTIRAGAVQGLRPAGILSMLNEAILRNPGEDRFCTVVYAQASVRDGTAHVTLVCGGHPLPLVLRADGTVEHAGIPGTLLGIFADPDLREDVVELAPGDALVLYTDGVTEAGLVGKQFGERALREALEVCFGMSARSVAEHVRNRVMEHEGGMPRDDVAVLVLRMPCSS